MRLTFPLAFVASLFACSAPSGLGLPCLWLLLGFFFFFVAFSLLPLAAPPLCPALRVFRPRVPWALASRPPPPFFFSSPPSVRLVVSCSACFPAWVALGLGVLLRLSRMLPYLWTLAVGVVPENDTVALSWLWRVNLRWIQKFINTGTIQYCGMEYPTRVFLGGDSPWLRHVLGITTHWMVASLYSFGIWNNGSLEGAEVPRSAQANALWHDQVRSGKMLPVQGRGCTHKPLLQVPNPYFQVVMCILHALMCIGRIVANEVHSLCVGQDPAVIVEVAQILRDYKTGITPKGKAEPDGEEFWRLLVAWSQL